jgi:hypothetical protein
MNRNSIMDRTERTSKLRCINGLNGFDHDAAIVVKVNIQAIDNAGTRVLKVREHDIITLAALSIVLEH